MSEDSWHLSKSVPITLIFGLLVQGAAIVWTVSMMMSDIEGNRDDIMSLQQRMARIETSVHEQAVSCLLYTSPSPRDGLLSRMPSSA